MLPAGAVQDKFAVVDVTLTCVKPVGAAIHVYLLFDVGEAL